MTTSLTIFNQDPIQEYVARQILANERSLSRQAWDRLLDPRRDYNKECGYPETGSITIDDYRQMYDRNPVATRVVEVLCKECWQVSPTVRNTEDEDDETEFEKDWKNLNKTLKGNKGWFKDETNTIVWEYLRRADILSGIGRFGVLLLGFDDGEQLNVPMPGAAPDGIVSDTKPRGTDAQYLGTQFGVDKVPKRKGKGKKVQLLFIRCFDESLVQVLQYESDQHNPRFGQPVRYRLTLNDPRNQDSGVGLPLAQVEVHWSRVIHIADNLGSSEIDGVPRQRPVYNRLLDLWKLYGGSAEMYWRAAFMGLSFETHPQLGGDVSFDADALREQIKSYQNGLQRSMITTGMHANSLAPQVSDPTAQIAVQIEAICIQIGVPKRVFMGSERGELASSQDDASWNDRLRQRQNTYLTPRLIVPFIDRLIAVGVLSEPDEDGYSIEWPDLDSLTDKDKAMIALQQTQAMVQFVSGNCEAIMAPIDFYTTIMQLPTERAQQIIETVEQTQEEDRLTQDYQQQQTDQQQQQFDQMQQDGNGDQQGDTNGQEATANRSSHFGY